MKLFIRYSVFSLLIFISCTLFAQNLPDPSSADDQAKIETSERTLSNQFNELKEKSNTFQEYKVVKITSLNNLWKNVNDSLSLIRKKIMTAEREIAKQNAELKLLKDEVSKRDKDLAGGEYEKAHINVLGIDMLKENYIYLSWSIIGALILFLTIGYFRFKSSRILAYNKSKDYEAINNEMNDYKQKAREKELKMGRELQTERNKVEELNQKIISLKKQVHL